MRAYGVGVATVVALGWPVVLGGQMPPRDDYYRQLPSPPPLVRERLASASVGLYGHRADPTFRDDAPADGIDDVKAARLLELAERFSPIIRTNGSGPPRDFRDVAGSATLLIDSWKDGRLIHVDSLPLRPAPPRTAPEHVEDSAHRALLVSSLPNASRPRAVPAEGQLERVLFVDLAGHDAQSWRTSHAVVDRSTSRIFAHFFVHEAEESKQNRRFQLVVQYWFFYPFNDGPNNHEGDWEHINVSITTRERSLDSLARDSTWGLLMREEVERILDARDPWPIEDLVIRAVDYYFHHRVTTIDYRDAYLPGARGGGIPLSIWTDDDFIVRTMRERLVLAEGRFATHPFVYIGGRNRGPDELIAILPKIGRPPTNESHGSYPFPYNWVAFGQLDAAEHVPGPRLPHISARRLELPWFDALDPDEYLTYRREAILLLPDWERVVDGLDDHRVRREFGWMLLPMRFGFPVSVSPGAGLIPRTDLGNLGAMSPTHSVAWNRIGTTPDHERYDPRVLRAAAAPVTPWMSIRSGYGVLNVPLAAWGLLPGGSVATTQLMPWLTGTMYLAGTPSGRTFFDGPLPLRITTVGYGAFTTRGSDEYARLLVRPGESEELAARVGDGVVGNLRASTGRGTRVWFNLFYRRLSLENTFGIHYSEIAYLVQPSATGSAPHSVTGHLTRRELLGGGRFDIIADPRGGLMAFARAGYGWLDYRVDDQRVDGELLDEPARRGGYLMTFLPSRRWWPNSTYVGGGIEVFAPREWWLLGRLGFGVRAEGTAILHRLRSATCQACGVNAIHGDFSISSVLGW